MMLHQDGSRFAWLDGQPQLDLIVTMDDATSTIYSGFLVEEEGTASSFRGLLETFTALGLPSSLYTDRGGHYFYTPKAGEPVDKQRLTQVGRARSVQGNNTGSAEDLGMAMQAIKATRIAPVIAKTFAIGDLAEAYRAQSNRPVGKVAIQLDW
jgi:hypothetical protein